MTNSKISFEHLNAYVDGELDPSETAHIARAIADSPELADQVAAISRLRSAVVEGIETPSLELPDKAETGSWRTAIAASIAFFVFVGWSVLLDNIYNKPGTTWLQQAWQVHQEWSIDKPIAESAADLLPVNYAKTVAGAYVPDLSSSRLNIVHAGIKAFPDHRKALLVGYRGTRGCKISLITLPRPDDLSEALRFYREGTNEAYAWQAGQLGYVLLSDGMDSGRFQLLAESVRRTTLQRLPFDQRTHLALRKSRDESKPCRA
ncbi:MAG: hypothetical protein HQ513_19210 [Rhodospirillales bacterium]|nr:hypothetical protein [Rhodospirillales bacterium]